MGVFSHMGRGGHLPPAPPPLSVDEVIANAERAANYDRKAPEMLQESDGPMVVNGSSIRVLRDLIAVEIMPDLGKIGLLFMTDATKSTRNQQFKRGRVVSIGPKALGMNGVLLHEEVLVSEYFGQELRLVAEGYNDHTLKVGRLRDIVGVFRDYLMPRTNRLLLERVEGPKMAGLLHLPEDLRAKQIECCVTAAGPDATIAVGSRVLIAKDMFVTVRYGENEFLMIDEPGVLCVL
jgi:co-chaperonin GroES (HSP10)